MQRYAASAIMIAVLAAAPACSDELGPSGPPTPLGVQWSKTVVDQDDYLEGFVASNHRLFVFSTENDVVAYSPDGDELARKPSPYKLEDQPWAIERVVPRTEDGGFTVVAIDQESWILGLRVFDANMERQGEIEVPFEHHYRRGDIIPHRNTITAVSLSSEPRDGLDVDYLYIHNIAPDGEHQSLLLDSGRPLPITLGDADLSPSGDVIQCEERSGSLWRIRQGVGLVGKLTFWDVKDDTADFCNLVQTKHGLVATWIGRDGIYGALFDAEGTKVLWGPKKVANGSNEAINLPAYYQLLGEDTLVGIDGDGFHLILTAIHVSDAGLRFSRQYDVEIRGPQVLDHGMLRVMDGALYMAYTNSTFSDSTVTLAKLDPLPE